MQPRCLVKVNGFEGDVCALLEEVREERLSIYDVPIASVVEQCATFLALFAQPDLELAGECILVSAALMELKSRRLLPHQPPQDASEEENDEEIRARLQQRLDEYRRYRDAAELLREMEASRSRYFTRPLALDIPAPVRPLVALPEPAVVSLLSALKRLLEAADSAEPVEVVQREKITLRMKMQEVWSIVRRAGEQGVPFPKLFRGGCSKIEIIATFLALLELLRLGQVKVKQDQPLGEIVIYAS
jgi:segregation and condensation protein A